VIENRHVYIESVTEVLVWDRAMSIRVLTRNERTSTASVEFCLDGCCFTEEGFLGYIYSPDHRALMPFAELAVIDAPRHRLAILMGLRKWIVLAKNGGLEKNDISLNRNDKEDRGFYSCQLLQTDEGVITIYESGVIKIGWDGNVLWSKEKLWDDAFAGMQNGFMEFINDSSGTEFHLDSRTGNEVVTTSN
jgi:hypothetical protein